MIEGVGYEASLVSNDASDSIDILQRKKEIEDLKKRLKISSVFAVPVFIIAMVLMYIAPIEKALNTHVGSSQIPAGGLGTTSWNVLYSRDHSVIYSRDASSVYECISFHFFSVWIGKDFYVNAAKALRHKSANMDVLVATGTSAAYFYSVIGLIVGNFVPGLEDNLFFETSVLLMWYEKIVVQHVKKSMNILVVFL